MKQTSKAKIINTADTEISPATESKQDTIISNQTNGTQRAGVSIIDGANLDAFSRLRVSTASYVFDGQFTYDLQPLLFQQITAQTGATVTHDATNRDALMTFSSTPTGGKAYMQTYEHFRYTSGRSQLIFVTFNFVEAKANVLKFAGYSDGSNGIEFQNNGTVNRIVIYSDSTAGDEIVNQADWNIDKLNGAGGTANPSGITLDITDTQILVIDFQALYVGRVRVGFDIDGSIVYVHEFLHANRIAYPYIQTANLPVRCGMTCTGTVSTTMNFICCSVIKEDGDMSPEGYTHTQDTGLVNVASGARTHAISLQPKLTFNSIVNRTKFILDNVNILVTGNQAVHWELVLGDVITGTTTFNDVNTTYSTMTYNTAGTTSGSPAIILACGFIPSTNQTKGAEHLTAKLKYPITLDADGNARSLGRLTLLLTGIGGTSTAYASITWTEIR